MRTNHMVISTGILGPLVATVWAQAATQAQISDALLRDRAMVSLPVTATVHVPLWCRTPAIVEMHGQVPSVGLRQAVLHVAAQEAARVLTSYHIQDRIAIVPSAGARAA